MTLEPGKEEFGSKRLPLFDANAHPILRGPARADENGFPALVRQLSEAGFVGGCAVALPDGDGYDPEIYLAECRGNPQLVPIAAWQPVAAERTEATIGHLKALGYRGIKIHPRRGGLSVKDRRFRLLLEAAAAADLVVFHCGYQFGPAGSPHPVDPLPYLLDAVDGLATLRFVLLHGGTVELLRYAEAFRATPSVLLDLSFTITRYEGSSVDQDIAYLFRNFDRRLCIGSDFPSYTPAQVRARFEQLSEGVPEEKRANVAWRNITSFLA